LISALAKGVLEGKLNWSLIGAGGLVGIILIVCDEMLRRTGKLSLPPLAVGIGIYLPMATTAAVVVGAVMGWAYERWAKQQSTADRAKRLGVLLASGLIVGESLFGVLLAGLIVGTGKSAPFAVVGDAFQPIALVIGPLAFVGVTAALYRWIQRAPRA
jgi:putative OPT family oligopeptide transporter